MLAYRVAHLKNATVSKIADFSRERNLGCRARDRREPRLRIFEFFQHRFFCHIVLERLLADMLSVVFGICRGAKSKKKLICHSNKVLDRIASAPSKNLRNDRA
jgi:hypothetical protein